MNYVAKHRLSFLPCSRAQPVDQKGHVVAVLEIAEMPATGINLDPGAENPPQIVKLPRCQDEIVLVGNHAYLRGGGEVAFNAFEAQRFDEFLLGEAGVPALEIRVEILVEVVQEREVQRGPEVVRQGIAVFQYLVLGDDIAAIGHDVGGKNHPGGADAKGDRDYPPCFVPVQELRLVGSEEKVVVYADESPLAVEIGAFRHHAVEECSYPPGSSRDAV